MGSAFVLAIWVALCGLAALPIGTFLAYLSWRNSRRRAEAGPRRVLAAAALPFLVIALALLWFGAYAAYCVLVRGVDAAVGGGSMVPLANDYYFCMIDTPERAFIVKNGCGGVTVVDRVRHLSAVGDLVVGSSADVPGFVFDTRTGGLTRLGDSAAALAQVPAAAPLHPPDEFYLSRRYGWQDAVAAAVLLASVAVLAWLWFRRFIRAPGGAARADGPASTDLV